MGLMPKFMFTIWQKLNRTVENAIFIYNHIHLSLRTFAARRVNAYIYNIYLNNKANGSEVIVILLHFYDVGKKIVNIPQSAFI